MRARKSVLIVGLILTIPFPACSDDGDLDSDGGPEAGWEDAGADAILDAAPDVEPPPDSSVTPCEPATRQFWMYDLSVMPPRYVQVDATCRAQGAHSQIYVADEIWEAPVTQPKVDALLRAFEESTPAHSDQGIYEVTTGTYGLPTDVDGNGRVILFVVRIPSYQGNAFDGYIRREDVLGGNYSNDAEMVYIDGVRNELDSEYLLGVLSHEFFHLLHLNHDPDEDRWLDETLAEGAMVLCGYYGDLDTWVADFAANPNQTLMDDSTSYHYGAGFLFAAYLYERFGAGFLGILGQDAANGRQSLENQLAALNTPVDVEGLLADWAVANYLDDTAVGDGRYGYEEFDVPDLRITATLTPGQVRTHTLVRATAAVYVKLDVSGQPADTTAAVTIESQGYQQLEVRPIAISSATPSLARVSQASLQDVSTTFDVPGVGGEFDEIVLTVVNVGDVDVTLDSLSFEVQ